MNLDIFHVMVDGTAKNQRDGRGIAVHHQGYMGNQYNTSHDMFEFIKMTMFHDMFVYQSGLR